MLFLCCAFWRTGFSSKKEFRYGNEAYAHGGCSWCGLSFVCCSTKNGVEGDFGGPRSGGASVCGVDGADALGGWWFDV